MFIVSLLIASLLVSPTAPPDVRPRADGSIDYVEFMQDQENGLVDVRAMDFSPGYLRRIADRSLRLHFRQTFRKTGDAPVAASATSNPSVRSVAGVTVARTNPDPKRTERWRRYTREVPPVRGFRAPVRDEITWPFDLPGGNDAKGHRDAATFVARHLAADGLVSTTLRLIRRGDLDWTAAGGALLERLRAVGIPTDLFPYFSRGGRDLETVLGDWIESGAPAERIESIAASCSFRFRPTRPGFVVLAEDGSEPLGAIRFQLASERPILGPRDGSAIDVLRQIVHGNTGAAVFVSLERSRVPGLLSAMHAWGEPVVAPITVVPTELPVSRWAQDNGKSGLAPATNDSTGRRVTTLLPRFASMNEIASKFVPGDSLVFRTLDGRSTELAQSPLLFQGGDLLPVVDPGTGRRILFLGEGEVQRNRGLGLSADQVVEAFRIEFGVDRVEVLPAISYHIDLELTVRRVGSVLVALLNDELQASRIIVREGIRVLHAAGLIDAGQEGRLVEASRRSNALAVTAGLWQILVPLRDETGLLPESLIRRFQNSTVESSPGNALRFLLALDLLTAASMTEAQANDTSRSATLMNYMRSLRRRADDRRELAARLVRIGLRVHRVPSLSDEEASINYLNGVHTGTRFLMPTFGGFYTPLDDAARQAVGRAFGDAVGIESVRTGALQSRYGGLHCVLGLLPRPAANPD